MPSQSHSRSRLISVSGSIPARWHHGKKVSVFGAAGALRVGAPRQRWSARGTPSAFAAVGREDLLV
ncbi:hypothetical protein [Amycolatopsis sp. NPDC051061]|uniref:hypothetical protein n=1 Tax=Amycolatopsis sp. NPDC051061 TaxID=3155042 RepID=UPI0034397E48